VEEVVVAKSIKCGDKGVSTKDRRDGEKRKMRWTKKRLMGMTPLGLCY
jgi:hypothetical protein